jgi:predicted peptidase
MGGYACWLLVQSMPDFFAGAVICCGAGQYWATVTKAFNNTPIMAVHGKQDTTVLPRESEIMAERINESGGSVVLTLLDNGHDVWTDIFTDSKTYYWLDGKMLNSH